MVREGARAKASKASKPSDSHFKEYTLEEVAEHRFKNSVWVVVKNDVFDVTKFLGRHPGGEKVILMAGGQDITFLMETSHPFTRVPWQILEKYKIGTVKRPFVKYSDKSPFYDAVKERVHHYFKSNNLDPKDPLPSLRTFFIVLSLWLIGYYFSSKFGFLWAAALLGVSRALFGINTMHAASHFAISHKPWVWDWADWLCFDIFMGGSSLAWNYQHVIGHHQHTNVFHADPDLPIVKDGDMRRVFGGQRWKWIYQYQAYYLPVLYTLLAFKTRYYDILLILGYEQNGNIRMNVRTEDRLLHLATKLFFLWYQFYVPMYIFGLSGSEMFWVYIIAELAAGAWLAYFFQVNHISDELLYSDQECEESTI